MKKFIIISLLSALVMPALACGGWGTDNYYLFSPYFATSFKSRVEKTCNDNWKAYIGDTGTDDWWSFHDDDVLKAARQKGDAFMVSYVENLQKYLKCVGVERDKQYEWGYPSKEEIAAQQRDLKAIRTYAQSKLNSKLRSQHGLLFMRCNMMLGQHQENITFWEQTASQYIETVYKDMMHNIYAGALYKTGREAEAGELFAEMNDYESLMTMFYLKRSYQAIRQHYLKNPTSKALPWLLTDFVNNAQEYVDNGGDGFATGKMFVRDINAQESWQMQQFCEMVVKEGKTDCPIMWKMAKAWLEFLSGKKKEAVDDILAATKLDGTARMKDNAHVLMLYITASQAKPSQAFDDYLADELTWLRQKQKETTDDGFFDNVETRLTNYVLVPHYRSNPVRLTAIARALHSAGSGFDLDTLNVADTEKYLYYTTSLANNKLDKFLKANIQENDTAMSDLIGTKYMRLCQWDKAIQWLENIPSTYYDKRGYAVYAANRSYNIGPWIKRQWLSDNIDYSKEWKLGVNPKLVYAREMQKMEGELNVLTGEALKKQYYELAIRYAQASFTGDCWFLMRDTKSVMDTVRVNEVDLAAKAALMLQKAGEPKDFLLKEKVLFAKAYVYMNPSPWYDRIWNNETYEYNFLPNPRSQAYKAFAVLAEFEKKHPSETSGYVSRCDEYKQFLKAYNKR